MKQSKNILAIAISSVLIPHELNYRDEKTYNLLKALKEDIAQNGQTTPAALEKIVTKVEGESVETYVPLQGFLRATAINELAAEKVVNPTTGKPFDSINAIVYTELTDRDRYRLKFDHANRISLNKREFQRAVEDGFKSGYTEQEIVVQGYGLFTELYPPNRKIEDTDQAKLDYYRGVLQTAKRAYQAPDVLHEKWMDKLAGDHKWPTNNELKQLVDIHNKECESPGGVAFSRSKPGPKFTKAWEDYMLKVNEAEANGEARPKSQSMMNHTQHQDVVKTSSSVIVKTVVKFTLREIPQDKLPLFDKLVSEIEKNLDPKILEELISFSLTEEPSSDNADTLAGAAAE